MSGPRYDRILASTALALILAAPLGTSAAAQETSKVATAPTAATQPAAEAPSPASRSREAPATAPRSPAKDAEPAAAPDPMAALDPADRAVAERIRDLLAAKNDKIFTGKKERAAVDAFYQNRNLAPLWLEKGVVNARAKAVIARLKGADADGLEARDYRIPDLTGASPDALAEADLRLTQTVLTFARHLQAGRFPYSRVSNNNIELAQQPPDTAEVLTKIADAVDAGKALDDYSPPHEAYKKLKAKLAELRGSTAEEEKGIHLPEGPLVRPGMEDPRIPLLRRRLNVAGDESSERYEGAVVDAVKAFQKGAALTADGMLGPATVRQLNGHVAPRRGEVIDLVLANMERWRWYPRDLGKAHVIVNQPDYSLKVMHNGAQVWTTRIVIGKPNMATPLLSETMKYITINPTWNVPPSIVNNEYLPALQQDPTVLDRMGLKVVRNRDGTVHIYQPPGEANALGRIRFNFPNRFLVYQHDTPDKQLFAHDTRAYSHGCMRVQDPAKYAEVLFNISRPNENWTADRIKKMFGTGEQDIQLPERIWVHLTYQSAFVDDAGKLQTRRDVYNLDSRTLAAIKSERGVVEPMQERKREEIVSARASGRAATATHGVVVLRVAVRRRWSRPGSGAAPPATPHYPLIRRRRTRVPNHRPPSAGCPLKVSLQYG